MSRFASRAILAVIAAMVLVVFPDAAHAQWPVTKLKNIKALPADISVTALVDTMRSFTRSLGVRCTYCHVGKEGEPLSTYDFASDDRPEKNKAREMLRMVSAINGDYLSKLVDRRSPSIGVQCATCHRGVSQPRSIQQMLLMAYDAGGADSLDHAYRALRTRYYGRAAYDFGEVSLSDVADVLMQRKQAKDAVKVHLLNTEMVPTSTFAFWMAGAAQLTAGDTTGAIASLQKAVAINPNNQGALALLQALAKKPLH